MIFEEYVYLRLIGQDNLELEDKGNPYAHQKQFFVSGLEPFAKVFVPSYSPAVPGVPGVPYQYGYPVPYGRFVPPGAQEPSGSAPTPLPIPQVPTSPVYYPLYAQGKSFFGFGKLAHGHI